MRFVLSLLAVCLAFVVGVFLERDFSVVDQVKQQRMQGNNCGCATGQCNDCTDCRCTKDKNFHCTCGCVETGKCDCPNCDHPKLK